MKNYIHTSLSSIMILSFLVTAGCQSVKATPKKVEADRTSTETLYPTLPEETQNFQVVETQAASSTVDGLSYEELRETTPPSPVNLRASNAQGIRLDWEPAPIPEIHHTYSDVVLYYNIYRRTSKEIDLILLATTSNTFYVDKMAQPGVVYYYAVSAVHVGPAEGQRTDEQGYSIP